jgi:hypothetical protein
MNLLYITFGKNVSIHSQAAFSIYSFLANKEDIHSINIITDAPDYYNHFGNLVQIVPVTEAVLQEWKGPHDFFWRIKIKAIEMMCRQYRGMPVVYLDTDTFLYKGWPQLKLQIDGGHAVMHENEGPLSRAGSKTEKRMWRQVKNRSFGNITIQAGENMWNAGVAGTPNTKDGDDCRMALQICDEMCAAGVTRRLIEQFALSVAFNKMYGMKPAKEYIAHYWSNKDEWNLAIAAFFTEAYCKQMQPDQLSTAFAQFNFQLLPVKKEMKNTALRLHKVINRIFKARETVYIRQQ